MGSERLVRLVRPISTDMDGSELIDVQMRYGLYGSGVAHSVRQTAKTNLNVCHIMFLKKYLFHIKNIIYLNYLNYKKKIVLRLSLRLQLVTTFQGINGTKMPLLMKISDNSWTKK